MMFATVKVDQMADNTTSYSYEAIHVDKSQSSISSKNSGGKHVTDKGNGFFLLPAYLNARITFSITAPNSARESMMPSTGGDMAWCDDNLIDDR